MSKYWERTEILKKTKILDFKNTIFLYKIIHLFKIIKFLIKNNVIQYIKCKLSNSIEEFLYAYMHHKSKIVKRKKGVPICMYFCSHNRNKNIESKKRLYRL